jgi:hypothetical protein
MTRHVRSWALAAFVAKMAPENNRLPLNWFALAPGFLRQSLVLVVLATGLIGSPATAETIYNFSFSGDGGVAITGGSLTVDAANHITSISGVVSGSGANGNINGLITDTSWFIFNTNEFYYPANPGYFLQQKSVAFYTGAVPDPASGALQANAFELMFFSGSYSLSDGSMGVYSTGSMSASPSAVPEIDPATGGSALSLVAGVLAMIEQRRRRAMLVA